MTRRRQTLWIARIAITAFLLVLVVLRPAPQVTVPVKNAAAAQQQTVGTPSDATAPAAAAAATTPDDNQRLPGVDVSHYQGDIDFARLTAAGVHFVYAKASDGTTYVDPRFAANKASAAAAGILFGGYHFFEPGDDPTAQADHFIAQNPVASGSLPPAIDIERAPVTDKATLVANLRVFAARITDKTGCAPVIYASSAFWNEYLLPDLADGTVWLADYAATPRLPDGVAAWTFWQHSQSGQVAGIAGPVDLDAFAGRAEDLSALRCS